MTDRANQIICTSIAELYFFAQSKQELLKFNKAPHSHPANIDIEFVYELSAPLLHRVIHIKHAAMSTRSMTHNLEN